jgi:hypothetical protein
MNSNFRLIAVNGKGQRLRLWDAEIGELVENLTIREAYAIMDAHRSGFRDEISGGYIIRKNIRNRIHHFEIIHPNGQHEVIAR